MGASMASHLLRAGHGITVFTRTRARAQALLDEGATWADNPRDLARRSDAVFSMVGYPSDVEEVAAPALPRRRRRRGRDHQLDATLTVTLSADVRLHFRTPSSQENGLRMRLQAVPLAPYPSRDCADAPLGVLLAPTREPSRKNRRYCPAPRAFAHATA